MELTDNQIKLIRRLASRAYNTDGEIYHLAHTCQIPIDDVEDNLKTLAFIEQTKEGTDEVDNE